MRFIIFIFIGLTLAVGGYFIFRNKPSNPQLSASISTSQTPLPSVTTFPAEPEVIKAVIITGKGNIELELYPKVAPKTVTNFIKLAKSAFYDGTKFHRVVADFVIQGGDPLSKTNDPNVGRGGPGYVFEDEINPKSLSLPDDYIAQLKQAGYKYNYTLQSLPVDVGAIAMANAGPNTNGSQFFIVTTKNQPQLYGKHTVFGKVVKGMEVVSKITQGDVVKTITVSN